MVQISEVSIISIDKSDDSWAIEGEILFESDLSADFSATYLRDDDEFEELELGINPGNYDNDKLKEIMLEAVASFEE